jgi:hypothetical protein
MICRGRCGVAAIHWIFLPGARRDDTLAVVGDEVSELRIA